LIAPEKPTEKTRDLYRFAVTAEPGKPSKLSIEEERIDRQQVAVTNLDDRLIAYYLSQPTISDKVKADLQEVLKKKKALQDVAQHRQQLEQQIAVISKEQDRIRQNMAQLDHATDLYKKYVGKFSGQEDEIEKLRGQIQESQTEETRLRKALDEFLAI
jgi:predicted RNase H-like nuclease (RuvC/YqgF family)